MARPKGSTKDQPAYRLHKPSGRAVVTINGTEIPLGKWGATRKEQPESWGEYDRVIGEWLAGHRAVTPAGANSRRGPEQAFTVGELAAAFWTHAEVYYKGSSVLRTFIPPLRVLKRLYGGSSAASFGPLKFKALREELMRTPRGWKHGHGPKLTLSRTYINKCMSMIRAVFRFGVQNEMVPPSLCHALREVPRLTEGRCNARETDPVKPVSEAHVEAVLPFLSAPLQTMVKVQMLTGMRPGEVCIMRTVDIDTSPTSEQARRGCDACRPGRPCAAHAIWIYRPFKHKTQKKGIVREIALGPAAQELLRPYLKPDLQAFLFTGKHGWTDRARRHAADCLAAARGVLADAALRTEAERAERFAEITGNARATFKRWGIAARHGYVPMKSCRPSRRTKRYALSYTTGVYNHAIRIACERAFPPPGELSRRAGEGRKPWMDRLTAEQRAAVAEWNAKHRFHVHQIRHAAATALRRQFGIEAAQVILGHTSLRQTEVYAELDRSKALRIMAEVG